MLDYTPMLDKNWTCPRCKYNNNLLIEHPENEPDRINCAQCRVYFHRVGWTYRFQSGDDKKVFVPDAIILTRANGEKGK